MQFRDAPFGYFLVLERGEELLEGVIRFATETGVRAASFSGIGAVDRLTLGFYDLLHQKYERRTWDEDLEVASLAGNLAVVDGGPFPHLHGVFCRRDFAAIGGHVFEAVVSIAVEIAVLVDPVLMRREPVDFCDLKLIELSVAS
jgi:predicted DNA-binding protein with PD1-like motif